MFSRLKALFSFAPIQSQSDPSRQFVLKVGALDVGVGAVLSQQDPANQKLHPCTFYSRCLKLTKVNYDVEKESCLCWSLHLIPKPENDA